MDITLISQNLEDMSPHKVSNFKSVNFYDMEQDKSSVNQIGLSKFIAEKYFKIEQINQQLNSLKRIC